MDNNQNDNANIFYNVKNDNGNIKVEKTNYSYDNSNYQNDYGVDPNTLIDTKSFSSYSEESEEKKSKSIFKKLLPIFVLLLMIGLSYGIIKFLNSNKKNRTFMIYMVGSDLESNGSFATFDLDDINDASIDLENNNVILMIGGSKKWHNFVNVDEIAMYKLESDGFKKIKSYPLDSMGDNNVLSTFLRYSYNKYPAKNYDLIFWNHGLGAVGLEDDEVSGDYLSIEELDVALADSPFKNKNLEVVIFNNCLAGNIHFANVMKKYADYMVGSEEVMYVSSIIDRLNFIGDVKLNDSALEIGKKYIEKTDKSMNSLNSYSVQQYDSTLSIIDLSQVSNLDDRLNEFISTVDLQKNYNSISRARMRLHTYSRDANYVYDTVDLFELVDALEPFSSNKSTANKVKEALNDVVKYNSALNNHSNGLSVYFPYYGTSSYIGTHLYYFSKLWDNSYLDFISNYHEMNTGYKRAYRNSTGMEVNMLKNNINVIDNTIGIELTDEEVEKYQRANIYLFKKDEDKYNLVLESSNVNLDGNSLKYNYAGVLKTSDDKYVSLYDLEKTSIYSVTDGNDTISDISIDYDTNKISYIGSYSDSGNKPIMGIVSNEVKPNAFYSIKYDLLNENRLVEDWKDNAEKEKVESLQGIESLNFLNESLDNCLILIELYDLNNDTYYSILEK